MQSVLQEDLRVSELFDSLPESVLLFKPVENSLNQITDFEIAYCNNASCEFLRAEKQVILTQTVLTTSLVDEAYKQILFRQCCEVWETGMPHEQVFYNEFLDRHFSVLRTKIAEGVLSVTRDRTAFVTSEKARKDQLQFFTNILDASADGVMILQAVRAENKEIVDFVLTHCNKTAFELAKITPSSIGKTLLEILPHLRSSAQFELHKKVIETGVPERIETTFRDEIGKPYGWFIVSLTKMGEHVISTFIDITEKKQDQIKIEEQANLLNSMFDASINGIFACEAIRDNKGEIVDLRIVKINKAFTAMIGLTPEVAEGANYHSLFPSGKKVGGFSLYCHVIKTGENLRKEIYYDDDSLRGWYDISAVKRGNNGIVITFTNITESKQNKQEAQQSAQYLQDVIDSSQTGILLISPVRNEAGETTDFRFKTINETTAALTGRKPAELIGKLHNSVFTNSVTNGVFDQYKEIADGKVDEKRFENFYQGDGIASWFDVRVKKRNNDLLITFLDITPIKRLQQEIESSARKLNTVVNTATAGMFTLLPVVNEMGEIKDFRFGIVNQAVATYIGEKAERLVGALGSVYFPAYSTNGLFDIYKDTYVTGKEHQFEFHYEDGYDVYFNIHTVKAGDEVLVTFTDQTTLKKLHIQLEASIEELKKSNASLEEFAYAASHDLQEPLRKINYFSERLRKNLNNLSPEDTRMFERMENAAARMSQLIADLLAYSQISRSKRTSHATDLNKIVQQVMSDFETVISEKKAVVTIATLPIVNGDPIQLTQMFQNLVSNSFKYSKRDVTPTVTINSSEVHRVINGEHKDFYKITVTDNGIGFDQENAEKIFKVFQRLHGQSEFPGTGIGLAIVHKVVENHHGFISAESQRGLGTTFTVLLPKA